ncbi:hypothetical protein DNH61_21390 [Paenibacillus sambharensis]|uniref:Uncharacterized protein n=1 Tax=Paenibacillus sambharensis TaxID=1803190 RepID=A0A2W1L4E1_9BACL|nr:hypothetical protein [Paenibacillus sambharensis]PZD93759.1 hypothetical protein DNH61_21390 [Paenibacillus sambharensis]
MTMENRTGRELEYEKGIIGLLLNIGKWHNTEKAAQIEKVAHSDNKKRKIEIIADVHTHFPQLPTTKWFTINLIDGDLTPETIHIYVNPIDEKYIELSTANAQAAGGPQGTVMSIENKLKPGLMWN